MTDDGPSPAPDLGPDSRTVGVEEEFLLVSGDTAHLVAAGDRVAKLARMLAQDPDAGEHELKQEQAEIGSKPCSSLADLRAQLIGRRRSLAAAARSVDARVAALATSPLAEDSSTTAEPRYRRLVEQSGRVDGPQLLTCGQHVHVSVGCDDEAVAAVDGLQQWLPTVRALSANSPFWRERDTDYASYRSVLWNRWPTAGATQAFGGMAAYRDTVDRLIRSGAALDDAAIYFDARVSARYPTVEIRVADVSTDVDRAVAIAALCRALVHESIARWRAGEPTASIRPELLRAANWTAARYGCSDRLVSLPGADPVAAFDAIDLLVDFAAPALDLFGDRDAVGAELARLRTSGTGADEQRAVVRDGADMVALMAWACDRTVSSRTAC